MANTTSSIYQFLKTNIGVLIGHILLFLMPKKAKQLSESGMTLVLNDLSLSEKFMRSAILKKLEKKQDYNTLESLHKNYWVNKGEDFFTETENSFENEFLPNCAFIFDELEKILSSSNDQYTRLVEIGTGNGRVLNYLSSKFSNINHFIGIDLSPGQTEINIKKYHGDSRLEFVASDGFDWVEKHGQSHTIFLTSRGVLEYFTEQRLQAFFNKVHCLGKIIFIAIEPKGTDHDYDKNPNSQPYGPERSFSHNYKKLFENAGFNLWHISYKSLNSSTIMGFIGAKN